MIICPNLYNGSQQSNAATGSNMNCGLQQQFDEATRHSVFSGLTMDSHWLSHRQQMHTIVKQEPRDDGEYGHYCAEDKATSFQTPLTPPGLPAVNNYSFPTPPQPDYSSSSPPEQGGDYPAASGQQQQLKGGILQQQQQQGRPASGQSAAAGSPPPQQALAKASSPAQLTPPSPSPNSLAQVGSKAPTPDPVQQSCDKQDHQENSQSSNSENEYYENGDSLRRLQMALQKTGMIASEEKLQCPMCEFFCSVRSQFNEHLLSHETKCTACDFNAETGEMLREHMRVAHENLYEEEMWTEEDTGLTTPKVNSQGKVKTFRCKQCEFSAVTKLEFWEHSRSHIKQERLLTCPKCPFVTEYKHHLEYHLRNHFGSKPFKCDKCSYSCVNKSMLNSHLKSHSNVYQFRCSDCTYATKYCHSLKLHLRKYGHNPAMVLNPDGSPNPLPIVDVYGTRRGPKQKAKTPPHLDKQPPPNAHHAAPTQTQHHQQQHLPVPVFNPYSLLPAQMPYYNLLNGFAPFAFRPDVKMEEKNNNVEKPAVEEELPYDEEMGEGAAAEGEEKTPLDLTCPEAESGQPVAGPETPVFKNRRKGKAFKLERIALSLQKNSEEESPKPYRPETEPQKPERRDDSQDQYNCSYCDISFKDIVMYTMHMGYHGYQDPFTCNMCGQQTSDKVAFFLHIARTSHS